MALFVTDEEWPRIRGDVNLIVEKANAFISGLSRQVEYEKARADAAAITAEQTCSIIEQRYLGLTSEYEQLEKEKDFIRDDYQSCKGELENAKEKLQQLEVDMVREKEAGERLRVEVAELRWTNREQLAMMEHKNQELDEKSASIKSYLDRILALTDGRSTLEGQLREHEAEMARSRAAQARLAQEKEILEQHNTWLNDELTAKTNALLEERRGSAHDSAELRSKLAEAEKAAADAAERAERAKERARDLEAELEQARQELKYCGEEAAVQESQLSAEVATASRLVELYKESSQESSQRVASLEGVVKSLETHLGQVEADYQERLKKEAEARAAAEQATKEQKERLEKELAEARAAAAAAAQEAAERGATAESAEAEALTLTLPPPASPPTPLNPQLAMVLHAGGQAPPALPAGITGTALAAALLRDGWSMAQMYVKYQEAADAWRHERQTRRQSDSLLNKVLEQIEQKADAFLQEREEHARLAEAYRSLEAKLMQANQDRSVHEADVIELKANLRRKEREAGVLEVEVASLQSQVTVLLKEVRDVTRRAAYGDAQGPSTPPHHGEHAGMASDMLIPESQLSIRDIQGLVEANSQTRRQLAALKEELQGKASELQAKYTEELERRTQHNAAAMARVLEEYRAQDGIVKAQKASLEMYRKLYEEQVQRRPARAGASPPPNAAGGQLQGVAAGDAAAAPEANVALAADLRSLVEKSQVSGRAREGKKNDE